MRPSFICPLVTARHTDCTTHYAFGFCESYDDFVLLRIGNTDWEDRTAVDYRLITVKTW